MHTRLAHLTFELLGIFECVADGLRSLLGLALELGHGTIHRVERSLALLLVDAVGNHLCESVAILNRHAHHTRNVLDGEFGSHRTIGHNLCHTFLAILLGHIVEYVGAAVLVEVNIDIRERDTVGV